MKLHFLIIKMNFFVINGTALGPYIKTLYLGNGTTHIRHQCRKTADLSCHRFLISSGAEKTDNI
jgi:hypothetical protein